MIFSLILLSACSVKYRDFTKVNAVPKRGTYSLKINNYSPQLLDYSFEKAVAEHAHKRLQRQGYSYNEKQTQYAITFDIRVDSAISHGYAYALNSRYPYSRLSKGIIINAEAYNTKLKRRAWQTQYDLYYFGDYQRDIKRTKGVISYLISSFNNP
ncbi:MAG: hypothetical protein MH472_05885 [Bacteroidia bacterium]|nr:hypothetical protein [Bacteroidia bacterium]